MKDVNKFVFNFWGAMHNLGLTADAEKLINNFIGDGSGVVYAVNPDGTTLELQKGVRLVAIDGLGVVTEENC